MMPVDWGFIVYAIFIPLLIILHLLELFVIVRHRKQYVSSFYRIFCVICVVDILACMIGCFLYIIPLYPIVHDFYNDLLGERVWLPPIHTLGYYLNCLSQILGVLMAFNRFTGLFLPQFHDQIWRRSLIVGILLCLLLSALPVWFLFTYPNKDFQFEKNVKDAEFPFYFFVVDYFPQMRIWWSMSLVTVVCNGLSSFIYVASLVRLCLFSRMRNFTIERNFFIVAFSSMIFSIPYMMAMLYLYLTVEDILPWSEDAMLFGIYQLPWLTEIKYLNLAPILLLTNRTIRNSIKTIFCIRKNRKLTRVSSATPTTQYSLG